MSAPYEVIAGPLTVYVAPVGTTKPAVNAAPSGSWIKLGTSGTKNYSDKGVTVEHPQTLAFFKPAGSTGKRKAWRTDEDFFIGVELVDLTAEQYAIALNNATVTTTAGPPATKSIPLQQGQTVAQWALLARGVSPIGDSLSAQYFVPIVIQAENPTPIYAINAPAMLACKFQALEDATLGFGTWEEQTA